VFLVQVEMKDIPSKVNSVDEEQKSLHRSLVSLKGDGNVSRLSTEVNALSAQVLYAMICNLSFTIFGITIIQGCPIKTVHFSDTIFLQPLQI